MNREASGDDGFQIRSPRGIDDTISVRESFRARYCGGADQGTLYRVVSNMMHICDWQAIDRIPGYMCREECEWLAEIAKSANSWTELGAYCGRSMLCVGLNLPRGALLQVVDISLGTLIRAGQTLFTTYAELRQKRPDLDILMACTDSRKAANMLSDSKVVFVDAAHNYENVAGDIKAWRPKCSLLCGHDFNSKYWPDVDRAVREIIPEVKNPVGSIWIA